jgi:peptidoglycan/xylan/chitin deacetylase (PgdA/CDA1 family)
MSVIFCCDFQAEVGAPTLPDGQPNPQEISERAYGGRVGVWRVLDMFHRLEIKATFATCGMTAERYPEAVVEIVQQGHELAAHAYAHERVYTLAAAEEEAVIDRTIKALIDVSGTRPVGWRSPVARPSQRTLDLLIDRGFLWSGDAQNDDLPFVVGESPRHIAIVPFTWSTVDILLYNEPGVLPQGIPSLVASVWRDEFDALYAESANAPKLMVVVMHDFTAGRAARCRALESFVRHVKQHDDVWIARYEDVARCCLQQAPKAITKEHMVSHSSS